VNARQLSEKQENALVGTKQLKDKVSKRFDGAGSIHCEENSF
jgi:hypothetical protein